RQAEEEFRGGDREVAGRTLMRAASGYEELGKLESAAVIYRSLSKSPSAPRDAGLRWLENAERRGQKAEAAQVACELGDRTLNDGDAAAARAWFERARALEPANELAQRRLARLGAPADAAVSPVAAFPRAPVPAATGVAGSVAVGGRGAHAAGAQAEPASGSRPGAAEAVVGPELSVLLTEFQRGVQPLIADDAQSNYDLGLAYREMHLLDQAVQCFRVAARKSAFTHRCAEMIGRSLLEQGEFNGAVAEFQTAIERPGLDEATSADLRFQLGIAHEAAGRPHEALNEFERAYAQHPGHPDVAQKIRV